MRISIILSAALSISLSGVSQAPSPLPGNPGNIFIDGQDVSVQLPAGQSKHWHAVGYGGAQVAEGNSSNGKAILGKLPVGFYSIRVDGSPTEITAAVIARLAAPPPPDSPIGVDTQAAHAYGSADQWKAVANLAALSGVSWERDRFRWRDIQPQGSTPLSNTPYDVETGIMHDAGLHVLNVAQGIPDWTNHEQFRFPDDLRIVYRFYRDLASKWRGTVDAIESANELDPHNTGSELASFQKAVYLGLKAGNPNILVCTNAWTDAAIPTELEEFKDNEVGPYFDTFDYHYYNPPSYYSAADTLWRSLAFGKPLWVTEFNVKTPPVVVDPVTNDPTFPDLKAQAQTLVELYATGLYLNVQHSFWFILTDYVEGGKLYGLLHKDLTPRPGYLSLAAVGRLLAGAKPIGQVHDQASPGATIYGFSAVPDGIPSDVLVAWNDGGPSSFRLPVGNAGQYDIIGRGLPSASAGAPIQLSPSPIFIVLPSGTLKAWASGKWPSVPRPTLSGPPPAPAAAPKTSPSPVVLQAVFTGAQMVIGKFHASASQEHIGSAPHQQMQIFAYNFSNEPLTAKLTAQVPSGWKFAIPISTVMLPPQGRVPISFEVSPDQGSHGNPGAGRITASAPTGGDSILEFHLLPQ